MRPRNAPFLLLALLTGLCLAAPGFAADEIGGPPTPPPPRGDLHIQSHRVDVVLNNGFATTQVDQVLVNPQDQDVEAEWAFPLPKEGSLSELSIVVGETRVVGEVVEKQEARRIYGAEKSAGQDAALAEQNAFYDYRIALARVPARGEVHVRIVYYQPLDIDAGVGRYVYPLEEGGTDDMKSSFWTLSKDVDGELEIRTTLKTSFPVDGLHCPSHGGFQARQVDEGTWEGSWNAQGQSLDRDFVLYYRLREDVPARVELLTHRAEGAAEGTYMAVVTPGSDLAEVEQGTDWAFVLDVSGSMEGEKIRVLTRGVAKALAGLGASDRFHLIAFNQGARPLTRGWMNATPENAAMAATIVEALAAGGSTNVVAGLETAYRSLETDRPSAIILVSDGVANTGPSHYRDFIALARQHDVRLFTFVIGNSANVRMLEDLAKETHGFAKLISVRDEIGAQLLLAQDRMSHQAMHGVDFQLEGAVAHHPKTLPSLYLGQQLVVFGRYDRTGPATLRVSARISGQPKTWEVPVDLPTVDTSNPELERLYALSAIGDLERESWLRTGDESEAKGAILDLALRYSLVTDYTSMVVVAAERKSLYGLGDDNARRRATEQAAAATRARQGNAVQVVTGGKPLAGPRAAHAPSRAAQRSSGGGRGGGGALGPLFLVPVVSLAWLARRRRRKHAA